VAVATAVAVAGGVADAAAAPAAAPVGVAAMGAAELHPARANKMIDRAIDSAMAGNLAVGFKRTVLSTGRP
jgi:hypothetical protein